ncbi:MAG: 3-phosphoshikimate 1-carboxyvinyltransferase [Candidatus Bathyarchaeia archaeon]
MSLVVYSSSNLAGEVKAPPSKSYTHRAIIASCLAQGDSLVESPLLSDDTLATIEACKRLGADIQLSPGKMPIVGFAAFRQNLCELNCRDSASTLRFMIPVAALADGHISLTGNSGLLKRPVGPLLNALRDLKVECYSKDGYPPVHIQARSAIESGHTHLPGDISSQFITGLLLACPKARGDVSFELDSPLESVPYVELTLRILYQHGIRVDITGDYSGFKIPAPQDYKPTTHHVLGDFSSAAYMLVAAAITDSRITIKNLQPNEAVPDRKVIDILEQMGTKVRLTHDSLTCEGANSLKGLVIDAKNNPDLIPPLTVAACFAEGETKIVNAERLRIKESNRLATLTGELTKMQATIQQSKDGLIIQGRQRLFGADIDSHNDHRIAMACAIAALRAEGRTRISQIDCVRKSYPDFLLDMQRIGAQIHHAW